MLHFICGKLASGKTTLAKAIACRENAVFFSEDLWLSRLFSSEIKNFADYRYCSSRFRYAAEPHVHSLLKSGFSVVLDFGGNTPRERAWVRSLFEDASAAHTLHWIDASDELCKLQLRKRNQDRSRGFRVTSVDEFNEITRFFSPPTQSEGFSVRVYHPPIAVSFSPAGSDQLDSGRS